MVSKNKGKVELSFLVTNKLFLKVLLAAKEYIQCEKQSKSWFTSFKDKLCFRLCIL